MADAQRFRVGQRVRIPDGRIGVVNDWGCLTKAKPTFGHYPPQMGFKVFLDEPPYTVMCLESELQPEGGDDK